MFPDENHLFWTLSLMDGLCIMALNHLSAPAKVAMAQLVACDAFCPLLNRVRMAFQAKTGERFAAVYKFLSGSLKMSVEMSIFAKILKFLQLFDLFTLLCCV